MKFQNPSIHHSKVNTQTDTQTDRQTDRPTDKPKAICPSNFFKVGGINRSAIVHELLSNNSLFVGQLRARDLICFTTDLQIVNYYSTIHC